jgi:hypothetical protein
VSAAAGDLHAPHLLVCSRCRDEVDLLQTINAELNTRNDSLVRANSDLDNLLDSTSIATLFLNSDLRIRRFTPSRSQIRSNAQRSRSSVRCP